MSDLQNHPLIQKYIEFNQFGKLIGMNFNVLSAGEIEYFLTIDSKHLATPLAAHGGVVASLIDAALGVAGLSAACENEKVVSTLEMGTHFLLPALLGDSLIAKANVISKGNRILVIEAKVLNHKNQLIATGNGTFNAYPKEKAGL
jgi:acyl-CoA thioesterase